MRMSFKPMQGARMFDALHDKGCIVMAANTRIGHVTRGILRAAKDTDSPIILELARSECNLEGGYTGFTPESYAKHCMEVAQEVDYDAWVLHADHISVKKGDAGDIEGTKKLIKAQIDAGFTSFAIDASHLFVQGEGDLLQALDKNITATVELAKFIEENYGSKDFGLEVEVGEVGRTNDAGMVITSPEEAVTFIKALNEQDVRPRVLAVANGSVHGHQYDDRGNIIEQVTIDIPRTIAIAEALKKAGFTVRIAQHGITGTPRDLIYQKFPHGPIIKGNVGTFWQDITFEVLKIFEPGLYSKMEKWTLDNYRQKAQGKPDNQVFDKFRKNAIKQFYNEIYSLPEDTVNAIEARAYAEALTFFKAFKCGGKAKLIREYQPPTPIPPEEPKKEEEPAQQEKESSEGSSEPPQEPAPSSPEGGSKKLGHKDILKQLGVHH